MQTPNSEEAQKVGRYREECLITNPLSLVLRVSQWTGLGPLTFRRVGRGWTVAVSPTLCIFTYIVATVMNLTALTGVILEELDIPESVREQRWLKEFTWTCDFIVVMLTASLAMYGAPRRFKTTIVCLRRIQSINKATLNKPSSELKACAVFIGWFVFVVFILTADYWDILHKKQPNLAMYMKSCYHYGYFVVLVLEMQYVFTALEVAKTMKVVGDLIEELAQFWDTTHHVSPDVVVLSPLYNLNYKKISIKSVNTIIDKMAMKNSNQDFDVAPSLESIDETTRRLASMYEDTCDVLKQLDDSYGVGVLLLLLSFLLHLVISLYYSIILMNSKDEQLFSQVLQLLWGLLHFLCTVAVMEPSHKAQLEESRVRMLISRMLIKAPKGPIFKELEKFSRYLLTNKSIYCPLGVCTLARSRVASIMGSVVTYLVIIVQFQMSSK